MQDVTALPPAGWDGERGPGTWDGGTAAQGVWGHPEEVHMGAIRGPLLPPWRCCGVGGSGWGCRGPRQV